MTTKENLELVKRVPIVEDGGAKWLVDTGCPFSYPNPRVPIGETMASFLGVPADDGAESAWHLHLDRLPGGCHHVL